MNIHFILQGKGGVGKTFISSLLIQYFQSKGQAVLGIDTDPVNTSLGGFKALPINILEILKNNEIDQKSFDDLVELMLSENKEGKNLNVIIDNGASSFIPLSAYLVKNSILDMLAENERKTFIHVPLTGGIGFQDTFQGLASLLENFPSSCQFVIWKNPISGDVKNKEEKSFEETSLYAKNTNRIHAIIELPEFQKQTFGHDLAAMLNERKTFQEVIKAESGYKIMERQRLKQIQKKLFDLIDAGNIL